LGEIFHDQERDYFKRRAARERELLDKATDESARVAHRRLAEEYERRALGTDANEPG